MLHFILMPFYIQVQIDSICLPPLFKSAVTEEEKGGVQLEKRLVRMDEFPERAELRRMQREQERERRRIRDRQRRQAMTEEQRERHLARRRRNYQLRRQRAANSHNVHAPFIPLLPNNLAFESSAGEASTSDEFQGVTSSTSLDYRVLSHAIGTDLSHEGSSINMETLACKLNNLPRLRLNQIRHLARNLIGSVVDTASNHHQIAAELKTKEDASVGDFGSAAKSLRLNSVKRLARSINSPPSPIEIAIQKDNNLSSEGIHLLDNENFTVTS
ncbi:uncharacterized protein [Cicer arietinum]|uniref:Uncharacterized protein LOC101512242 isoform X1 n=2 Tax=Cicer arietinum TaxID=3827 RepID=A0A1S2XAI9_CICAR|nr:uncharacterized protein LOC101512242 isoform X1 [Cicer arietinum]